MMGEISVSKHQHAKHTSQISCGVANIELHITEQEMILGMAQDHVYIQEEIDSRNSAICNGYCN